ncbi:MAG: T9SS type B sorting domain-containing protein, partial [Chitinophagaceae bacterium]
IISTIAGTALNYGFSGDGGPAKAARLETPTGIAVDKNGIIYIADGNNHRIRKIDASGIITTIAGTGTAGYSGDGGPAINAKLNLEGAVDLALDSKGNLYISQPELFIIRRIDASGLITTVIGNGTKGYSGDNGNARSAQLSLPNGMAIDKNDNIYVADPGSNTVRKITPAGIITTFAGSPGNGYSGDGGPATAAKFQIGSPTGLALDDCGNMYVADYSNHVIRKINPAGIISTVAGNNVGSVTGNGGPAISASIWFPANVAVDPSNNLYIPDAFNNTIRKVNYPSDSGPVSITISADQTGACEGAKVTFTPSVLNEGPSTTYEWFVNGSSTNIKTKQFQSQLLKNKDKVSLTVTTINNNPCSTGTKVSSAEYIVTLVPGPRPLLADRSKLCSGESHIFDPGEFKTYLWQDGSTGRAFEAKKAGTYFVTVTDNQGCTGSDTSVITGVFNKPVVTLPGDTTLCDRTTLTIRPDQIFSSYRWSDGSSNNSLKITQAGTYSIEVSDENDCKAKDFIVVKYQPCNSGVNYLATPNAFTPNGDGLNDQFRPGIPGETRDYRFAIYNRWGQMIFETRDRNKAWDGNIYGSRQSANGYANSSSNTYSWICVYTDESGQRIARKGSILLIR